MSILLAGLASSSMLHAAGYCVVDLEKVVDGSKFDEIIEDISKWGKILMIKITPSFVI